MGARRLVQLDNYQTKTKQKTNKKKMSLVKNCEKCYLMMEIIFLSQKVLCLLPKETQNGKLEELSLQTFAMKRC